MTVRSLNDCKDINQLHCRSGLFFGSRRVCLKLVQVVKSRICIWKVLVRISARARNILLLFPSSHPDKCRNVTGSPRLTLTCTRLFPFNFGEF